MSGPGGVPQHACGHIVSCIVAAGLIISNNSLCSDLARQLFDNYLFPDLSLPSNDTIEPQVPVMHSQTRQEMYNVIRILCRGNENYLSMVECLEDIIPEGMTLARFTVLRLC